MRLSDPGFNTCTQSQSRFGDAFPHMCSHRYQTHPHLSLPLEKKTGGLTTLVLEAALRYCSGLLQSLHSCAFSSVGLRGKSEKLQVLWFNLCLRKILQHFLI